MLVSSGVKIVLTKLDFYWLTEKQFDKEWISNVSVSNCNFVNNNISISIILILYEQKTVFFAYLNKPSHNRIWFITLLKTYSTTTSLIPKPTFTPLSTFTSPPSQYSKGILSVNTFGRHVSSVQVTKLKLIPTSERAGAPFWDGTLTTTCISFRLVPLLGMQENVGLGKVTIHFWGASGVSFRPLTNCTSTSRRSLPPLGLICKGLSRL